MHSCTMAPATGTNSPNAPRSIPPNASPIPITTLCSAIRRERRAIEMASAIRSRRSTIRTMSAASDDAVAPRAPIATPTSAAASAGASFRPSPTKIVTPSSRSASTAFTFSAGSRSDRTRSTPSAAPTDSATSGWSPVTMTTRLIPARRSVRITRGESGRIGSSMTSAPAMAPSTAMNTHDEPSSAVRRRTSRALRGMGAPAATNDAFPSATWLPSTLPSIPAPCCSTTSVGNTSSRPCSRDALTIDVASTCGDTWSSEAARRSSASAEMSCEHLDVGDLRDPGGERAGLVEQQHLPVGERLQRPAALHDDPASCGARDARHHRDGHREDQRARRRHHEHRQRAYRIPREEPGGSRRSPASPG